MRLRILVAIGALLLLVAQVRGVGQAPSTPQQPTFRAITTLVEVDAIVKDSKGRFVPGLTAADFEVREDGVVQKVEQLYVVAGPDVKTAVAVTPPAPPAQPAQPALPAPAIQRTFGFLFDQEHIEPGGFDRAKKAALQFMASNFREGDIGGVVNGGTMVNNRLTNARAELESAIAGLRPLDEVRSLRVTMREWPRLVDSYEIFLIAEKNDREAIARAVTRACDDDVDSCRRFPADAAVITKARNLIADIRASGQRTMHTVGALCDGLAKLPGRKTIIFLSDGFFAEDSWGHLREVEDRAARASVRIYSLDTRGLNRGTASSEILEMGPHGSLTPAVNITTSFDVAADAPNSLAVDTGGLVIRNENDFAKALAQIADDTSSYYILGYRTTNTTFDGKFRNISVRVTRPGLSVRARRGYVATSAPAVAHVGQVGPFDSRAAGGTLAQGRQVEGPPGTAANAPPAAAPPAAAPPAAATPEKPPATPPPPPATAATPPPAVPAAPSAGATTTPPNANVPGGVIRLQPDVKDRLAALGKVAPISPRAAAPPENVLAQARAGWEAYEKGDVKGARVALSAAAAHPAAPAWVHYTLGWTEFALFEYAAAGVEWERVRNAAPDFESIYFDLADSYLQQREFGKALEALRAAEKRWPNDVEVYNAIGVVQTGRGALNDAIKTFEKGVSVNPDDATACYNLAKTSELRYIQSQRLRAASRSSPASLEDRNRAIEYYRRTVTLRKAFVEEARDGLRRLGVQ